MRRLAAVPVLVVALGAAAAAGQEAARPAFSEWLAGVRADALARGIRAEIVDEALATVTEPEATVIERDRTQAETVLTLETYLSRQLTARRISTARQMLARHRTLLDRIGERYGVAPRFLVAIWGLESNFGQFTGVRPTIGALATLAWDPRRAAFFRAELLDAMEILDRGDIPVARMRGSWAGAMGQPQFMPSSYLKFAQDFDEDGRRDIWGSRADVFASIANYLKEHGWNSRQTWGREVALSPALARTIAADVPRRDGGCSARRDMTVALPVAEWHQMGVRRADGGRLPATDFTASLVSGSSRHFLVYGNYDRLLDYNCAHAYAITVAFLADRMR